MHPTERNRSGSRVFVFYVVLIGWICFCGAAHGIRITELISGGEIEGKGTAPALVQGREAVLECLPGVLKTRVGYGGGNKVDPVFHNVGNHAECLETYPAKAKESKRYTKLTIFFNKRPDITDEEFHRYWSEVHGPLFTSVPIVQNNLVKYNQYHNDMAARNKAASLGFPVMEFDAAAELWGEDMETILAVFQDPEYRKTIGPDEGKFGDREGVTKFMFGYDQLLIDRTSERNIYR